MALLGSYHIENYFLDHSLYSKLPIECKTFELLGVFDKTHDWIKFLNNYLWNRLRIFLIQKLFDAQKDKIATILLITLRNVDLLLLLYLMWIWMDYVLGI